MTSEIEDGEPDGGRRSDQKRRVIAPYLKFVRNLESDVDLETRISHVVYDFFEDDIDWLIDALEDSDVTAGFSVPAIHLRTQAAALDGVRRLVDDGHEVLVHGYRHTSYMDTAYDTVDEELADVRSIFEAELDIAPSGFHVPFMRCSEGTVRAASEHEIDWIVGTPAAETDAGPAFLQPESPYDLQLYERGHTPPEVIERLDAAARPGSLLLCHPNIQAIHGGSDEFGEWLRDTEFVPPSAIAQGEQGCPGLLLDCFPPFGVR